MAWPLDWFWIQADDATVDVSVYYGLFMPDKVLLNRIESKWCRHLTTIDSAAHFLTCRGYGFLLRVGAVAKSVIHSDPQTMTFHYISHIEVTPM